MQNDIQHTGIKGMRWGHRKTTNISEMTQKQKLKSFGKEKAELSRQINRNADIDRETILVKAGERYYKKNANKEDYNPDDWDYDYETKENKKLDQKVSKAHAEVNSFLEKKYDIKMSDFKKTEKVRIANGEKAINAAVVAIAGVSVAGLLTALAVSK